MLADSHIRSVSQLNQAAASRNWALYQTILDAPNALDVKTRETLRADLPRLMTEAHIEDRLRTVSTVEDANRLLDDINANRVKSPDDPLATFDAKLDSKAQLEFAAKAEHKKTQIVTEAVAAEKRRREVLSQEIGNDVKNAIERSVATGQPAIAFYNVAADPRARGIDYSDFHAYQSALEADPKRYTSWSVYDKYVNMSPQELRGTNVYADRKYLADPEFKEVENWKRAAVEGRMKESVIPEKLDDAFGSYVKNVLGIDPQKDGWTYTEYKARIAREYLGWRKQHPNDDFLPDQIGPLAGQAFSSTKHDTKRLAESVIVPLMVSMNERVTDVGIERHKKSMKELSSIIEEEYARTTDAKLQDNLRAMIYAEVTNPASLNSIKAMIANDAKEKKLNLNPEDKRLQIRYAVKLLAPPEVEPYLKGTEEREINARRRVEENVEAEKLKAEEEVKAAQRRKEYAAIPGWERVADGMERDEIRQSDFKEHEYFLAQIPREEAEFEASVVNKGSPSRPRTEFFDREGARERTWDKVAQTRAARARDLKIIFDADRSAFREFIQNVKAGDATAVELNKMYGYPVSVFPSVTGDGNFPLYRRLRREGKVF
jgi:hypothetical protein